VTPFRVVGSTTRARTAFLALEEVEVEAADGDSFTRGVVRHPGAVVVVPVDDDGCALLVRQYRAALDADLLEVVAGKRDVDDEPPAETARRELEEEVGRRAGRLVPLCEFYNSPGFTDEYTYLYCALDLTELDGPRGVTAEEAAMTIERVALDDVDGLIASGTLTDAKSIIGLVLTRRYLAGEFGGRTAGS
jgi:8-oxo-dGTP pyrophosphatase MutT (NUDIX family)